MPILDSIQVAEEKAEKLKAEASEKVKSLLDQTKIDSEAKVKALFEAASLDEKKQEEKTIKLIEQKEKEVAAEYENQDQKVLEHAKTRMEKAVGYIIKKVLEV